MSDATQPILKAEHLGITFGGLKAVSNFNMTINKGELIGLIGSAIPIQNVCREAAGRKCPAPTGRHRI